jgi:hypothetical protein
VQQAEISASIRPPLATFSGILSLYRNHLAPTYGRGQVLVKEVPRETQGTLRSCGVLCHCSPIASGDHPQTLDPRILALTDPAARATFFDDALVTGESGRMSELMALWHMGRESLLDFAIRHELGHAFCNDANEMDAERVARLLEQKKPISCKAKVGANPHQQPLKSFSP